MRKCSINKNLNFKAKILGVEFETNSCGKCKVVEYTNAKDLVVEFEEYPCRIRCTLSHLRLREVSNPMYPSCYGVGYIGVGEYRPTKNKVAYKIWMGVLDRCYGRKEKYPAYDDVTVCDEWLNFQNFAKWYEENFPKIESVTFQIDKDLLQIDSDFKINEFLLDTKEEVYVFNSIFTKPKVFNSLNESLETFNIGQIEVRDAF